MEDKLEEEWKDIENYPNYQISNIGRVKSKERYTKQRNGMNLRKEKLLTPQKDHKGYLYVRLYNENGWKYFKIHILVAKTFIPNLLSEPTVDHIDRNKDNNKIDNLRWATRKEQTKHMHEVLGVPYADCSKLVQRRWNNETLGA